LRKERLRILPSMELEHRVGQLLLIGLPGTGIDGGARELLESIQPGGVLLTSKNIESAGQLAELTASIRGILRVPPLIAIDQEGGSVDRLRAILSPMPSADLLRASKEASAAARMGEITADALRLFGFNVNLGPVLDISCDDSADNGLQGRYLGSTVADIVRLAGAYLEGLQRGGIVGVGKHFPGLGATIPDSHEQLPQVDRTRDQLINHDIQPYVELFSKISARLNAVVVGHAHYPAFDGPIPLPASLSKNVITSLLREELGFKGPVITDDLEMGAVLASRPFEDSVVMAVEAGSDMVMVSSSPERATEAWQVLARAAREGRITRARISKSFDSIARVKSMISPPHMLTEGAVLRLRERIAELNASLQHSR
jgi:beta-N-acetylhexosaminidase